MKISPEEYRKRAAEFDVNAFMEKLKGNSPVEQTSQQKADYDAYIRKAEECKTLKGQYDNKSMGTSADALGKELSQVIAELKNMTIDYEKKYGINLAA